MRRRLPRVSCALAGLALVFALGEIAHAATAKLSWTPPTEREDGTPLPPSEIAGYKIYYGTVSGDYSGTDATQGPSPLDVPITSLADPQNPTYNITGLTSCQIYYFVATTYDTAGAESTYSNEASKAALDAPVVSPPQTAGPGALQISWSGLTAGDPGTVQSYNVHYDTDSGEPYQGAGAVQGNSPISVARTMLGLQVTGLSPSATYYVVVESTCPDGTSKLSTEVMGVTGAVIPQPDAGVPPPPPPPPPPADSGVTPPPPPPADAGVLPPPPPPSDSGVPPRPADQGAPTFTWPDAASAPRTDSGMQEEPIPWPDGGSAGLQNGSSLRGGCAIGGAPTLLPLSLLLGLALLLRRRGG